MPFFRAEVSSVIHVILTATLHLVGVIIHARKHVILIKQKLPSAIS